MIRSGFGGVKCAALFSRGGLCRDPIMQASGIEGRWMDFLDIAADPLDQSYRILTHETAAIDILNLYFRKIIVTES